MFLRLVRRVLHGPDLAESFGADDQEVDWARVYELAEAHGLLSLLGTRLTLLSDSGLPRIFANQLEQYALANALRNRMLLQEYRVIQDALECAEVVAIPLKGISYIQRLPDYMDVRELADIDLLVDQKQIGAARKALESLGYTTVYASNTVPEGAVEMTEGQEYVYESVYHEYSFASADGIIFVDIHWKLSPAVYPNSLPEGIPLGALASNNSAAGRGMMSPAYELVYLCMHAAKDGWCELKWAIDIAYLLRSFDSADWQLAWELAGEFRLRKMLLSGILLTQWLTGEALSGIEPYQDSRYKPSARTMLRLRQRLLIAPERKNRRVSCFGFNKAYIALCDTNRDKFAYVYRMLAYPQPRDFVRLGLTPALLPYWGFFRPFVVSAYCLKRTLQVLFAGRR